MTLSARDLDNIRTIVQEEIERALRSAGHERGSHDLDADESEPQSEGARWRLAVSPARPGESPAVTALRKELQEEQARRDRRRKQREARPIPDTPFVDIFDARRLLQRTKITVNAWSRRGRLTRHKVEGRVQVSRVEIDAILAETRRG